MNFIQFLKTLKASSVIDPAITLTYYVPIDLSINNTELKRVNVSSSRELEHFIWSFMNAQNAKVAYGGYLERRGIYRRSDYFTESNAKTERNIHLGVDLWIKAGTVIYAPLSGTIHSFNNNTNYGDYGPTIILKHHFEDFQFFTLYGHLSLESLEGLKVGVEVKQGEQIATLGTSAVNGDYTPHLHFQIIRDIQGYEGDYPGVCSQQDLKFYKENCPNPNLLLQLI